MNPLNNVPTMMLLHGDLLAVQPPEKDSKVINVLVHAVNCKGVWGAGVAKQFALKYPEAYKKYRSECSREISYPENLLGGYGLSCVSSAPQEMWVAWIYTSVEYGSKVSPPNEIVSATHVAIKSLVACFRRYYNEEWVIHFHSPKMNSGLFKVPWDQTKAVINEVLPQYNNILWTVWSN